MTKKFLMFSFSALSVLIFTSCAKEMSALDPSYFRTSPNPLELKGGKIEANVAGKFPVKFFNKNAVLTVTPVLKYVGGEARGKAVTFQGEKVQGNHSTVEYKAGGNYSMPVSINYMPVMSVSELYLDFDVVQKTKEYTIPSVKVADGVISTAALASADAAEIAPATTPDAFQQTIQQAQNADIMFLIGQANLRSSETQKTTVVNLLNKIKEVQNHDSHEINRIDISGYASPDGSYDFNQKLAEKREAAAVNYLNSELKKLQTNANIDSKFTAEDWEGFQQLMEKSDIQDKELILRVLSMYQDPEQREREIRNIAAAYKVIAADILPQLRRSRLNLIMNITGKSDEEIRQLAANSPSELGVEELLYAATLSKGPNVKEIIYNSVTEFFPNDPRGWNNLGAAQYALGKADKAQKAFDKAASLNAKSPDLNFNLGLLALSEGNTANAEQYLGKAAGTTGNLNKALGTMYLLQGDYSKATTSFGSEVSNNAALIQILNKNYSAARNTLISIAQPDAKTAYLKAIVSARTNDRDSVYNHLREALKIDAQVAKKALTDVEFAKYFSDPAFLSIVQ
ncbi:MAG: tetratricopeptide repeat protein [Prevotellaceae bacterium]|jgi:outer membrane protein OmpA-like peptidoglycan-associated protein/Flp pilus assembly protein TadD|nr:tetratricopeptide repeat protein [Prevotellaceae bacterium]